jgi:hypothetical protein
MHVVMHDTRHWSGKEWRGGRDDATEAFEENKKGATYDMKWGDECREQRAESREQRAESGEQRAEREQRAQSAEQRAESTEQRAESTEQRAQSTEHRVHFIVSVHFG